VKKKLVIYTVVFGRYDEVKSPLYPETVLKEADLVCLTDDANVEWPWTGRKVSLPVPGDPVKSSRYPKILTHRYFPDYELSLYLDGNMRLACRAPSELIDLALHDRHWAYFPNSYDQCLYKEGDRIVALGLERRDVVVNQVSRYRSQGFPDNFGKINSNILVRRHNELEVISFAEQWWREVETGSYRDQLSFDYVRWKTGLAINVLQGLWTNNPIAFREEHRKSPSSKTIHVGSRPLSWVSLKRSLSVRLRGTAVRVGKLRQTGFIPPADDRGRNKDFRVGAHRLDLGSNHPEILWAKSKRLTSILDQIQPALQSSQPRILNIGASIGVFESCLAQRYPMASYISYEPDPGRFGLLRINTSNVPGLVNPVELHQSAVGTNNGYTKFHRSKYSIRVVMPGDSVGDTFPIRDIAEVCDSKPDFMRLNAPGLGFPILDRLAKCGRMQQLQTLLIEYHRIADLTDQLAPILLLLQKNGFRYHLRNENFPHPSGGDEIRDRVESVYRILAIRFASLSHSRPARELSMLSQV